MTSSVGYFEGSSIMVNRFQRRLILSVFMATLTFAMSVHRRLRYQLL